MDLDLWRLFVLVSDVGSLSRAAVMLDRPQSVVSRQMSRLETECGGQLFDRTGRGMALSELGRRLLPQVKALLHDADALVAATRVQAGIVTGRVCIGMLPSVAHWISEPFVRQCRALYPNVTLSLTEGTNGQLGEAVARGVVDVALLFREPRNLGPTEEALLPVPACLIGRPGDSLTSGEVVAFDDLAGAPIITSAPPGQFRSQMEQVAARRRVGLNLSIEADSLLIQKRLISAGFGYGLMTPIAVADEVAEGRLSAARIVEPDIEFVLALCRTTQRPMTDLVRESIKLIKQICQDSITGMPMGA